MRVPKGGSSCATCKYLGAGNTANFVVNDLSTLMFHEQFHEQSPPTHIRRDGAAVAGDEHRH